MPLYGSTSPMRAHNTRNQRSVVPEPYAPQPVHPPQSVHPPQQQQLQPQPPHKRPLLQRIFHPHLRGNSASGGDVQGLGEKESSGGTWNSKTPRKLVRRTSER